MTPEERINNLINRLMRIRSCLAATFNSSYLYVATADDNQSRKYLFRLILAFPDDIPVSIFDVSSDDMESLANTLEAFAVLVEDYKNLPREEKPYLHNVIGDIRNGEFIERSPSQHRKNAEQIKSI